MGSKISYPLSYDKVKELGNIFSIFNGGEFIGMIQEVRVDKAEIHYEETQISPGFVFSL